LCECVDARQVVGTSPWRGVFNVIVSWHMLCCNGDGVVLVLGQYEGGCQARDSSSADWSAEFISHEFSMDTDPNTTTRC